MWIARVRGTPLPMDTFLTLNAFGLALMIAGVVLARRKSAFAWIRIAMAGIVLMNAAAHVIGTVLLGAFSPGIVSGVVLWIPLGWYTLAHSRSIPARHWRAGWIVAIGAHAVVSALAFAAP